MIDFKKVIKGIRYHGLVLLRGFLVMLFGTGMAGMIAAAAYGLFTVPSMEGYLAVCSFVCAIGAMAIAVAGMYAMGGGKKGAKK